MAKARTVRIHVSAGAPYDAVHEVHLEPGDVIQGAALAGYANCTGGAGGLHVQIWLTTANVVPQGSEASREITSSDAILAAWSLLAYGDGAGTVEPNDYVPIGIPYSSLYVAVHVPTNQVLDAELVVYAYSVRERERARTRVLARTRMRTGVSLTGFSSYNQPISIENEDVFPDLQMTILRDLDLPKLPKIPKIKLPDGPIKLPDVLKKLPITDEIKRRAQLELTKRLPPGLKPGTIGDRVRKLRKRVIRADEAYRCCNRNVKQSKLNVLNTIGQVMYNFTMDYRPGEEMHYALVGIEMSPLVFWARPGTSPLANAKAIAGGPQILGALVLFSVSQGLAIGAELGQLQALDGIARAVHAATEEREDNPCLNCIESKLLGQDKPRRQHTGRHRSRK